MKKIFLLIIVLLFGCDQSSLKNNQSRIVESSEATKRVQEIVKTNYNISAELLYESFVVDDSLGQFNYLDTSTTGIDFVHNWNPNPRHKDQLNNSFIAAGVAVGDIDNDGLSDVFLSRQSDGGRLYKNLGGFRFEDITIKSGISPEGMWSTGATFVDINNDGEINFKEFEEMMTKLG